MALPTVGGAWFRSPAVTDSGLGLAILFVLGNFLGSEATVIYREEARIQRRPSRGAVYIAVASIGIFYAVAAWAFVAFFGADNAQAAAVADMADMFNTAMVDLVGTVVSDIVTSAPHYVDAGRHAVDPERVLALSFLARH